MSLRRWFYLDPLNMPRGPISDGELERLLEQTDRFVFTEGMTGWELGSVHFANDRVEPLGARGPGHLDAHGQPRNRRFNALRRADRQVQELLGLARGMIADGEVSDAEARALARWIELNTDAHEVWPIGVLADRLGRIFADGRVDPEERAELLAVLQSAVGERPDTATAMNRATRLPLDEPAPVLRFAGQSYVFTGRFAFGTRAACEQAVVVRGGSCDGSVSQRTRVLVIGTLGSDDWAQSSFGRKIEKAVHLRANGVSLSIVSEEHWSSHLTA